VHGMELIEGLYESLA